jgi:hypothetical protein
VLGRDSRLPLVGSHVNGLPSTWAAMWIDFHVVLLLLPAALVMEHEDDQSPKEASDAKKHGIESTSAAIRNASRLFNVGASIFFALTCCSRAFAPTFAVFAVPLASGTAFSIFSRLADLSTTAAGNTTKRRAWRDVNSTAVNAARAVCVFAAFM